MAGEQDVVARYARSIGIEIAARTVLVEGTTDADLFSLAAELERKRTGRSLTGPNFTIAAAGIGSDVGTSGVIRELIVLRGMATTCLLQNGLPKYRFVGLLDNDQAGRHAMKIACGLDRSLLECRDLFRLQPVMPLNGDLDPTSLRKKFEMENLTCKDLDWEVEDLLPESLLAAFLSDHPTVRVRTTSRNGKVHRDFNHEGKAKLHRFVKQHAIADDLAQVVGVIDSLRFYLNVKT